MTATATAAARWLPAMIASNRRVAAALLLLTVVVLMVAGPLSAGVLVHDLHLVPPPVRHLLLGSTVDHYLSDATAR